MNRPNNQLPNLEKLFKDEDDQDFAPIAGSNLAAIFGTPQKLGDGSTSLKQSSQKKPSSGRNTPQTVQPTSKTEVIVAKVVHAYKLLNGQYTLIGKLGIALTGNTSARVYQIILYRSKQEHVSTVTLTAEFSYTIRENNYATYYDGNNENWSLLFENEQSCIEFAREVGVSRFHSRQTRTDDSVFYQNLTVNSETNDAKENDEITVKSIICTSLNQPLKFDDLSSQIMNVKISEYDNWERSLLNCSKGLKRLLVLPSSKQISLGPGFPKDREIIMMIEIIDITRIDDNSPSLIKPPVSSGKASILSRMAKMGQSMLPKVPTSTTTDSEDTEEEIHVKSPRRFKPEVSASHSSKHQSRVSHDTSQDTPTSANVLVPRGIVPASSIPSPHRPMITSPAFASPWPTVGPIQQQYVTMDGQYYPIHQAPIAQSIPVGMDPNINVFLSETRTQNTEIRMGMAKISDNVQKLLDKFHVLEVQSASSPMILRRPMNRTVDEMILREEQFSGGEMTPTSGKNLHSEISPSDEYRSKDFERERKLQMELNEARGLLEEHAVKFGKLDSEKREWSNEKLELCERIERLEKTVAEGKIALETSNDKIVQLRERNTVLESSISKFNAEKPISNKSQPKMEERTVSINQQTADIKRLMNNTYRMLLTKFTDQESYTTDCIKETLADTIRTITFSVLNDLHRDETEDEESEILPDSSTARERRGSFSGTDEDDAHTLNRLPSIPDAQEEPPPVPQMDEEVLAALGLDTYGNQ